MSFFRVALQKRDKLNSIAADGDNKLSSVIVSAARVRPEATTRVTPRSRRRSKATWRCPYHVSVGIF